LELLERLERHSVDSTKDAGKLWALATAILPFVK